MREILFRGKRKDNGEWVYGDFVSNGCGIVCTDYLNEYGDFGEIYRKVCPETIGQYTGLTDKNGKKIFEGDIIGWNDGELDKTGKPYEDEISEILFCEEQKAFICRTQNAFEDNLEGINPEFIRVLGNIHDNPELLKEGVTDD